MRHLTLRMRNTFIYDSSIFYRSYILSFFNIYLNTRVIIRLDDYPVHISLFTAVFSACYCQHNLYYVLSAHVCLRTPIPCIAICD